ncbi:MAG: acyl-CoA dehydratase activase-related protein [Thermosediminibacteraceae bacterium]|nr:acyl-CoA dehydratase activase-related protein [Thermosediminibacteraceae bacterium]
MKIGIPRALAYFAYYPFINTFFEKLGMEVVVSDPTSKEVIDAGVEDAVTDACVPVKLFHGHVKNLMGRVDYIFVPRLVRVNSEATFCPKFLGLPDMLVCSIDNLTNMLEVRIEIIKGKRQLFLKCLEVARRFNKNFFMTWKAYRQALRSFESHIMQFLQGGIPPLGILSQDKSSDIKLGVVGYPYLLYDSYVSLDLIKKLIGMGAYVVTPEMVPEEIKKRYAGKLRKMLFWTFSNSVLRTAFHFLETGCVDGIIHVTAFGCGPDFIVDKVIELEAKERKMPFLTITLDEHTGQEGINTRLEAFVDMLRRRKRKEAVI